MLLTAVVLSYFLSNFANSKSNIKTSLSPYQYKMIESKRFYQEIWSVIRLKSNIKFLKQEIVKLIPNSNNVEVITKNRRFNARFCI